MTNSTGNGTGVYTGGIPLNVTLHAWPVPKQDPVHFHQNDSASSPAVAVKTVESATNYTNGLRNLNATGYVAIDDDLTDTGFTDVQTFILAGIATVIPLLITVVTILGIRFLWKKYRARKGDGYEGVLQKDESSEPLGKLQSYSIPQELKTSESQFTVTPGDEVGSSPSPQVMTPKSNGSVITMTLKNNHLIVETEETTETPTGLKIESQGTMTKFVTSTIPDFKQQLTAEKPEKYIKESVQSQQVDDVLDHGALVHSPPEGPEDDQDKGSCNTGLSQSDLSLSSTESQNPSYRYGNQSGYDSGGYGYPEYSGYSTVATSQPRTNTWGPREHRPYTRSSSVMESSDPNQLLKDVLLSDIQAREKRMEDRENRYQEEQRLLGNGEVPEGESQEETKTDHLRTSPLLSSQISHSDKKERVTVNELNENVNGNTDS